MTPVEKGLTIMTFFGRESPNLNDRIQRKNDLSDIALTPDSILKISDRQSQQSNLIGIYNNTESLEGNNLLDNSLNALNKENENNVESETFLQTTVYDVENNKLLTSHQLNSTPQQTPTPIMIQQTILQTPQEILQSTPQSMIFQTPHPLIIHQTPQSTPQQTPMIIQSTPQSILIQRNPQSALQQIQQQSALQQIQTQTNSTEPQYLLGTPAIAFSNGGLGILTPSPHQTIKIVAANFHNPTDIWFTQFLLRDLHTIQDSEFKRPEIPWKTIRKIMKADEDVGLVSADAPVLMEKACEFLIMELTTKAWQHSQSEQSKVIHV